MLMQADVAIVGSGFGGSLLSLILARLGFRCVLIDRGKHPRFAIGESSTPAANLILRDLAWKYDLPRLAPLAKYGPWQATYPHLVCGLKRGFSYFKHSRNEPFRPEAGHGNEFLVAASSEDEWADTHWLRSDVDRFLVNEAGEAGVRYLDEVELTVTDRHPWRLAGERAGRSLDVEVPLLVDASGEAGFLRKHLQLPGGEHRLRTHSRGLFGHFTGVASWGDWLEQHGGAVADHPFDCDAAALHHILDEGWMWQLRFQNGVTSVGFAIDSARCPLDKTVSADDEWQMWLGRYPSVAEQLAKAICVQPSTGLRQTDRMQRWTTSAAGDDWVLLPHTAGFIDPLHSTGIAHTMSGVERLADILQHHGVAGELARPLERYSETVGQEITLIDRLVSACYRSLGDFPLFTGASRLYFAAATTYERQRLAHRGHSPGALFLADDPAFLAAVTKVESELDIALASDRLPHDLERFEATLREALAPYDHVGLFASEVPNMLHHTAVAH
jgi:tetracycline 7-halogenase / FADH2 O2-dependent halogenase